MKQPIIQNLDPDLARYRKIRIFLYILTFVDFNILVGFSMSPGKAQFFI